MNFQEFVSSSEVNFAKIKRNYPNIRKGQFLLNHLHSVKPDLANMLAFEPHNVNDPYYDDGKIPSFWTFVEQNWNQQ